MTEREYDENYRIITECIAQFTDVEIDDIKMESDLVFDLGLTSFDLVCLVNAFEEDFGVFGNSKVLKQIKKVGDIYKIIVSNSEKD